MTGIEHGSTGFFTEAQLDRANLKTMVNQLPPPWTGNHLLALLVVLSDKGTEYTDLPPKEAKQKVIDWYCTNRTEVIVEALENMVEDTEFQMVLEFQRMMHQEPELLRQAIEAVENGWRPGDRK